MGDSVLHAKQISKKFGGLQALDNVSLDIKAGEVHALVGENGAGKSTFIKILGGIYHRDSGSLEFLGEPVAFPRPMDAIKAGIAIIHQELSMLPHLNVIENVFMGRMPCKQGIRIDWHTLETATKGVLEQVGLEVDPYAKVCDLSISQRQLVEIAKALSINARLIIMDEPNSSLTEVESEKLFQVVDQLRQDGRAILYVSHKIEEVLRIADRITTFRDGRYVGTINRSAATVDKVIQMMVGRELTRKKIVRDAQDDVVLSVKKLSGHGFRNVSFDLHRGEVLGFSGLVGAGRSEVMRAIFGADPIASGEVVYVGRPIRMHSPSDAIAHGIAMVPEDRKKLSLFLNLSIQFNMSLARLSALRRKGMLDHRRISQNTMMYKDRLNIRMEDPNSPVKSLSGGNQQKTILARWLSINPKVLILDEPTHGVDVGAKSEIYQLIRDLADQGMSIMLVSSELPEVITMSDRIVVMHEGRVNGIVPVDRMDEETIMACATGCADPDMLLSLDQSFEVYHAPSTGGTV